MSVKILHSRAEHKQNRAVTYDHHGNPYPTNLKKHLTLAQQYEREDAGVLVPAQRVLAGVCSVGVLYLAYQIALPLIFGGAQ